MSLTFYVKALLSIALPLYTLWSIFRDKFFKSALDNIPGPPSESFFTGVARTGAVYLKCFLEPAKAFLIVSSITMDGTITRSLRKPVSNGDFFPFNLIHFRIDGGVMKIKAAFGVCSEFRVSAIHLIILISRRMNSTYLILKRYTISS